MKNVGLVSLLKTKIRVMNMGSLFQNVFSGWCFSSNYSFHKWGGGRIVIAWDHVSFKVDILHVSSQIIYCSVIAGVGGKQHFCTFPYAFNDATGRVAAWNDLVGLVYLCKGPWIIQGDFKCVMNNEEIICATVRQ